MTDPGRGKLINESPDLRGQRIYFDAADHPHAGKEGVVFGQEPCEHGRTGPCGYDWLLVRLDDGTQTQVFEPEASLVNAAL